MSRRRQPACESPLCRCAPVTSHDAATSRCRARPRRLFLPSIPPVFPTHTMDSPAFVAASPSVASATGRRGCATCACRPVAVPAARPRMAADPVEADAPPSPAAAPRQAPPPRDAAARQAARERRRKAPKPVSNATWANNFLSLVGFKGAGSIPGWDLRPVSLREAAADAGASTCTYCKGTGRTQCTFCMGLTATGADGKEIPCPGCAGETTVTCSTCFGSTKQIELKGQWWKTRIDTLYK